MTSDTHVQKVVPMDLSRTELAGVRVLGQAVPPRKPVEVQSINIATGDRIATIEGGQAADAVVVVDAAAKALDGWRATSGAERAAVLRRLARAFDDAAEGDLPRVVSSETGKRLVEAENEFRFSARYFDLYARLAEDSTQPWWSSSGGGHLVRSRAVGVAAAVTPWNFPVSIPARKIAPALAAGCTVVWKPSEVTSATSSLVAELIDAEVPAGLTGMVLGAPAAITEAWLDDPRVRVLSFTGSTRVGRIIATRAAATFTRTVLELGGQAPFIILDDADIDAAVSCLTIAKFRNNGQSCIAANRAWAPSGMIDEVAAAFESRLKALRVGDPLDSATDLGPLALPTDPSRLAELVADAESHGATTLRGDAPEGEHFTAPALCVTPDDGARMLREEIFGPVLALSAYDDLDEPVQTTRALPHGLAGYLFTGDRFRGMELSERLDVGLVGVNSATPNLVDAPFGGRKDSGWGYEGGPWGLEPFVAAQTVAVQEPTR